jgi:transposase
MIVLGRGHSQALAHHRRCRSEKRQAAGRSDRCGRPAWVRGPAAVGGALDRDRVWALEHCRHVSGSLERFLIGRGERVLRIATHLSATARKRARQRGQSDPIDALNVARAAVQEGLESFPVAHLDGPELDLRLLVDHRERLVRQRVGLNNTLQWHLHDL